MFRKAGATLQPIELPDFPTQAIRFILNTEAAAAFDDLTRSRGIDQLTAQGPGDWPNTFRTLAFRAGRRVHRARAGAHAADAENGRD